jgi:hypothetical protein
MCFQVRLHLHTCATRPNTQFSFVSAVISTLFMYTALVHAYSYIKGDDDEISGNGQDRYDNRIKAVATHCK